MDLNAWIDKQNYHNVSTRLLDSPTITVERKGGVGIKLNVVGGVSGGGGGGTSTYYGQVPVKITSVSSGIYSIDLYENGYTEDSTGSGTMQVLDMALAGTLAVGEQYLASRLSVVVTGD